VKIAFHGADRTVTGSCHRVECNGKNILIDCGMYQGGRELTEENAGLFGFDPADVDFPLLTHAHLDHCGRIPLLAKRGFEGEIISTAASMAINKVSGGAVIMAGSGMCTGGRVRHHLKHNL